MNVRVQLMHSRTVNPMKQARHRQLEVMRRAIVQRSAQRAGQVCLELALNALKAHTKTQLEVLPAMRVLQTRTALRQARRRD